MADTKEFPLPGSALEAEEGMVLAPKFDANGLITCVATDARSGDVLMVAHMNAQALQRTIATGDAWYYSRSRQKLWRKGESDFIPRAVGEIIWHPSMTIHATKTSDKPLLAIWAWTQDVKTPAKLV